MKVLKFIMASALCMLTFIACSDSKSEDLPEVPEDEGVDYLVMFYGQGGGNLDNGIIGNIYQALDEGSSEKVKMTFQYKLSEPLHEKFPNIDGTRRFTLDDNKQFIGTYKSQSASYPHNDVNATKYLAENLKSEKIGDAKYDMPSAESLASFIKWSKELYPDAKHVILIINGHGTGWKFAEDGKAATRSILPDDNFKTEKNGIIKMKQMSATDIITAVKEAGGVELFYTDACLMAMYENLYEYANAFKYMMSSMEVTPGVGGHYTQLLRLLKSANNTEAGLVDAMHKYVDYLVTPEWWDNNEVSNRFCDIGLYDLSKLDNLTPVLKKIADTLVEKYTSDEKLVSPSQPDMPYDSYHNYINAFINQTEIAYGNPLMESGYIPESIVPYMEADNIEFSIINGYEYAYTRDVIDWMWDANNNHAQEAYANHEDDWLLLRLRIMSLTATSYSLTDMLRNFGDIFSGLGVDDTFAQLHDELIAALKAMAYIRCTEPIEVPDLDQAYELCSPGLQMIPLNDRYYVIDFNYFNLIDIKTVEEAKSVYQNTTFDKKVGWSRFLSLINVQPSIFSNPTRAEVLEGEMENDDEPDPEL